MRGHTTPGKLRRLLVVTSLYQTFQEVTSCSVFVYALHKMKAYWRGTLDIFVLITLIFCINTEIQQGNLSSLHTVPVVLGRVA